MESGRLDSQSRAKPGKTGQNRAKPGAPGNRTTTTATRGVESTLFSSLVRDTDREELTKTPSRVYLSITVPHPGGASFVPKSSPAPPRAGGSAGVAPDAPRMLPGRSPDASWVLPDAPWTLRGRSGRSRTLPDAPPDSPGRSQTLLKASPDAPRHSPDARNKQKTEAELYDWCN